MTNRNEKKGKWTEIYSKCAKSLTSIAGNEKKMSKVD